MTTKSDDFLKFIADKGKLEMVSDEQLADHFKIPIYLSKAFCKGLLAERDIKLAATTNGTDSPKIGVLSVSTLDENCVQWYVKGEKRGAIQGQSRGQGRKEGNTVQCSVWIDKDLLKEIDSQKTKTRSDFINEAVRSFLFH